MSSPVQEVGQWRDFALVTSVWPEQEGEERGARSTVRLGSRTHIRTPPDKAGRQAAGKGKQGKGSFLTQKSVIFNYNPTMLSTQKSQARTL